jgi:hypothetical protein
MGYRVIMRKLLFHLDNAQHRKTRFLPDRSHPKASHHMFKWFAAPPPDDSLFLAQEPVTHWLSDGRPFIRIAEQF